MLSRLSLRLLRVADAAFAGIAEASCLFSGLQWRFAVAWQQSVEETVSALRQP